MIKPDVILFGISPEMTFVHGYIREVFNRHNIECVPTSIVGKKHKKYSLHPPGYAIDYRTKHIQGNRFGKSRLEKIDDLMFDLKRGIPQCDFVFEHEGKPQEHIHAEFDPKNDPEFARLKSLYRQTGAWPK